MKRTHVAAGLGALALGGFALLGGEYNVRDWLTLRRDLAGERAAIERLEREVDSLADLAERLESDPGAQERAAREELGMIREGELLYRIVPAR